MEGIVKISVEYVLKFNEEEMRILQDAVQTEWHDSRSHERIEKLKNIHNVLSGMLEDTQREEKYMEGHEHIE